MQRQVQNAAHASAADVRIVYRRRDREIAVRGRQPSPGLEPIKNKPMFSKPLFDAWVKDAEAIVTGSGKTESVLRTLA